MFEKRNHKCIKLFPGTFMAQNVAIPASGQCPLGHGHTDDNGEKWPQLLLLHAISLSFHFMSQVGMVFDEGCLSNRDVLIWVNFEKGKCN